MCERANTGHISDVNVDGAEPLCDGGLERCFRYRLRFHNEDVSRTDVVPSWQDARERSCGPDRGG